MSSEEAAKDSCIVRHFNYYAPVSDQDRRLLIQLEDNATPVRAGIHLWDERDQAHDFCTLKRGWAFSYRNLENGTRQILDIYLPGDIIGLREFAFSQRLAGVQMVEDGEVCFFPHRNLTNIFRCSYSLTSILFAIASRQQVMLTERLVNLARRNAREKLAHFLLEMFQRLRQTQGSGKESFRLPLSQEVLADLLGLSPVHVSRTFTALGDDGLVIRDRHSITLPDLEALKEEAGFDDRYLIENMRPLFDGSSA
ncbi:Crp/Fnr family transcriptional regulator [Billgrantia kenyensis]|uniref:Crp/Fnr family transcriptional regulator n=1 Tax=Billgrantia kenyensis TaxID=321266 RepID=A0A7W0AEC1_9GAMM|nr:Crp/Fnr family transcriptional regulator [Halomonas kenyensis]MBA2779484.1 Crp/Fnr family transcriptional regulator [Halomonas kenyensis]MCG6662717.1 Crp/Fnr family transcriptional regulator [Halomonas kenyensis]